MSPETDYRSAAQAINFTGGHLGNVAQAEAPRDQTMMEVFHHRLLALVGDFTSTANRMAAMDERAQGPRPEPKATGISGSGTQITKANIPNIGGLLEELSMIAERQRRLMQELEKIV